MKLTPGDRVAIKENSPYARQADGNFGTIVEWPPDFPTRWVRVKWDHGWEDGYPEMDLILQKKISNMTLAAEEYEEAIRAQEIIHEI